MSDSDAAGSRLVYLDEDRATACVERLAASRHGRDLIRPVAIAKPNGLLAAYNVAVLMSELVAAVYGRTSAVDLLTGSQVALVASELHPAQIVAVRGVVRSGTDVQPTSFLLSTSDGDVRVLTDRTYGLHLNQRYLTERKLMAITTIQSVPRRQMRCIALFTSDRVTTLDLPSIRSGPKLS